MRKFTALLAILIVCILGLGLSQAKQFINADGSSTNDAIIQAPTNIATAQVSVGSTATLIAAARPSRRSIQITALGTTAIFIGGSGVTTSNGSPIPGVAYANQPLETSAAIYGITASGTQSVAVIELY